MATKKRRLDRAARNKLSSPGHPVLRVARTDDYSGWRLRQDVPAKTLPLKLVYLNLSDQGGFGRMEAWLPHICRLRPPASRGAI